MNRKRSNQLSAARTAENFDPTNAAFYVMTIGHKLEFDAHKSWPVPVMHKNF